VIGSRAAFLALTVAIAVMAQPVVAESDSTTTRLVLICALERQAAMAVEAFGGAREQVALDSTRTATRCTSGSIEVIVVRSPMGLVNNALTARAAIDRFAPDAVVSVAMAGWLGEGQPPPGGVLVVTTVAQHDSGTWKPYGFVWSAMPGAATACDVRLAETALSIAQSHPDDYPGGAFAGGIVGGSQFVMSPEKRAWLVEKFGATAVDMQSSAIADACAQSGVPLLILRSFSDSADVTARSDFSRSASKADLPETRLAIAVAQSFRRQ